jgi:hypothetical protein
MQPLLGGNELMYRQGLIARYGLEYTESIENSQTKQDNTNTLNKN